MPSPVSLGVDFGTSHTVAVLRVADGGVSPLLFDGSPLLPSAVYADGDGELFTGRDAISAARVEPARFEPHPKRLVDDGSLLLGPTEWNVRHVFAAVLSRVRSEAVRVSGTLPTATFTHPAGWGPARRQVLEDAAVEAGFAAPRLLPEPVAAATYFARRGYGDFPPGSGVVVYDFGGGTFDVSVVSRADAGFTVLAVDGAPDLGGVDLDQLLLNNIGAQFDGDPLWARLIGPRTPQDRRHHRMFADDVRSARERLSRHSRADLVVPLLDRDVHVTREELEELARPVLGKAVRLTQAVIREARLTPSGTAGVFLVGGTSRMPLAATMLHQATGIEPTVIDQPELVVASGATLIDAPDTAPVSPAPEPVPAQRAVVSLPAAMSPPPVDPTPPPLAAAPTPPPPAPVSPVPPTPRSPSYPPPGPELRTVPRTPGWLTACRVLVWIAAAGLMVGAVWAFVFIIEGDLYFDEYDISLDYDTDGDGVTDADDTNPTPDIDADFGGESKAIQLGYVPAAILWPVYLLTAAVLAAGALQLTRPNPASRRIALTVAYAPIVVGLIGVTAESIVYEEPMLSPFVFLTLLPLIPVIVLLHRRAARDWFDGLRGGG